MTEVEKRRIADEVTDRIIFGPRLHWLFGDLYGPYESSSAPIPATSTTSSSSNDFYEMISI